ncbi:MAG: hypothetical protein COA71_11305 [SAR86 cluster bacterium]|uniref:Methyltransferase type 11 domain-containing protein n=1 Tax=SAR86 cluster bacterium TaxID=2030880 RepID=A0A2A5C966_9GAMM|nr:MAG: hypothetical protein COA71_11305 [SAR86 cluster bacterium]
MGFYSTEINNPYIVDVGCGSNKIGNSKSVVGCDMFPSSDDIIQAAADDLPFESGSVDILFSAHCLEHMANPIKTLQEWCRVVGDDGVIWLVLPHRNRTFDSLRDLTAVEHLFDDLAENTPEEDMTHWEEFRAKVILSGHRLVPSEYIMPAQENKFTYFNSKRLIHHHVWTLGTFIDLVKALGLEVTYGIEQVPGREDSFSIIFKGVMHDSI